MKPTKPFLKAQPHPGPADMGEWWVLSCDTWGELAHPQNTGQTNRGTWKFVSFTHPWVESRKCSSLSLSPFFPWNCCSLFRALRKPCGHWPALSTPQCVCTHHGFPPGTVSVWNDRTACYTMSVSGTVGIPERATPSSTSSEQQILAKSRGRSFTFSA